MATLKFSRLHGQCLSHQAGVETLMPFAAQSLVGEKKSENPLECLYSMGPGEAVNSPYPLPPPPYSGDRWVSAEPKAGKAFYRMPVQQLPGAAAGQSALCVLGYCPHPSLPV